MLSGLVTTRTGKRALQATPLQDGRPLVIAPPGRTIQRTRHRLNGEIFPDGLRLSKAWTFIRA
jgi:hypothetical protein